VSITVSYFKTVIPELASEADARVQIFLDLAKPYIARNVWEDKSDYAHALFAAHMMTSSGSSVTLSSSSSGTIQSEKVGDLSTSYAVAALDSPASLGNTKYGTLFLQLRATLTITPFFLVGC
jgi:hypothetical protein